jgi:hypothetical protein
MATYDELAKQNPQSAAQAAFRFLSSGGPGSYNASQLDYYTQALSFAVQHLVAWGLSGHEPSLKAYQGLLRVIPQSPYTVSLSSSEIYRMTEWIDDVPRKLMKTRSEYERDLKALKNELSRAERQADPSIRVAMMDTRERIKGHDCVIKSLNERMRLWSSEAPKLKVRNAKPAK